MSIITVPHIFYPSNRFVLASSRGYAALDAAEEFVAMVFRVPKTGTLNKIAWQCGTITAGTSFVLKISLETVAEKIGEPVATSNATKTLYAAGAESADITSLTSNAIYYTAINGTTGIDVVAGSLVAVTFRLTSVTGSVVNIGSTQHSGLYNNVLYGQAQDCYTATYLGSSWSIWTYSPIVGLEYSDGMCSTPHLFAPYLSNSWQWGSNDSPDRRGIKFKVPYACRLYGVVVTIDTDSDVDIIMYDSDEYSVKTGFPITLKSAQRRVDAQRDNIIIFPTKPEILADTWYRLVTLPKSTTDAIMYYSYGQDDGATSWLGLSQEGASLIYTYRNGAPSSGDHAWTDENYKPYIQLIIDGIEASAGGTGGGTLIGPSSLIS